ncbi:hypothetical protein VHEMI01857 [[Torrubiella] hemipterigena]|uniref:Sedoheptulose-1,7-bisphosphatase n=1 Tax=[Torrubiella] hemipterigena TaxID=1531966 RepID=A0A0A1T8Q5_9HYPO|nr:hypothetical protein VHEMI01857 [[Torrubiella] hemipterigena]
MDEVIALLEHHKRPELTKAVIPVLLDSLVYISKALRQSQTISLTGGANSFGDGQLNVDISAENLIREALALCPAVATATSEEDPVEKPSESGSTAESRKASGEEYTVAFDPLDGSSIIGANWSVGTIIGIWDGSSALNQSPKDKQVASILGVLGPRTTAIVSVRTPESSETSCIEVGLADDSSIQIIRPQVRLLASDSIKTRYFAPANLRATGDSSEYLDLVTGYASKKYTLRYSGGLVPDVIHALSKGHGIYTSPVTEASPAKLRRLYELCPIALTLECAGGKAVDPVSGDDILFKPIAGCDERGGLICGTTEEVDFAASKLVKPRT